MLISHIDFREQKKKKTNYVKSVHFKLRDLKNLQEMHNWGKFFCLCPGCPTLKRLIGHNLKQQKNMIHVV